MKVYVVTHSEPLGNEIYLGVAANKKAAEKIVRQTYPHAKPTPGPDNKVTSYVSSVRSDYFISPVTRMIFIREEEV